MVSALSILLFTTLTTIATTITVITVSAVFFPQIVSQGSQINDLSPLVTVLATGTFNWGFREGSCDTTTPTTLQISTYTVTSVKQGVLEMNVLTLNPNSTGYTVSNGCTNSLNIWVTDFNPPLANIPSVFSSTIYLSQSDVNFITLPCFVDGTCILPDSAIKNQFFQEGFITSYRSCIYDASGGFGASCNTLKNQTFAISDPWQLVFYMN